MPPGRGERPLCHNTLRDALGRCHAYRHFFASWLIDRGFGPKRVQALMGHSSIAVTYDVYGHLFPQEDDHERFAAGELAVVG
jgi:integrase